MARVVGAMARHESEHKAARHRRKHEELAAAGKVSGGGGRAFGYELDYLTIRPDEADEIRGAVARILGGGTLRGVLADWAARGITTPTGAPWRTGPLRRMLASARIAGKRAHHGVIVADAAWPGIIGVDEHHQIVALFAGRAIGTPRRYMLTGLLHCSGCGSAMIARPLGEVRSYVCASDLGGCGKRRIKADPLEALVVDAVLARAAGAPTVPSPVLLDPIAGELAAIDAKVAELGEMWAAGEIDRAGWRAASDALAARRSALASTLAGARRRQAFTSLPTDPTKLRAAWEALGVDERRGLLGEVIERVEVGPGRGGRFDAGRVHVVWLA